MMKRTKEASVIVRAAEDGDVYVYSLDYGAANQERQRRPGAEIHAWDCGAFEWKDYASSSVTTAGDGDRPYVNAGAECSCAFRTWEA